MSPGDFPAASGLCFGRDIFLLAVRSLQAADLLTVANGMPRWGTPDDARDDRRGSVTAFGLTDEFLQLADVFGVSSNRWHDHWYLRPSPGTRVDRGELIELRARKRRVVGQKLPAEVMAVDHQDPEVQRMAAAVERINHYLSCHDLDGLLFKGLRRIFSDGDQPGFTWNKGGRFYSLPGSQAYERWNVQLRQGLITIDGEKVVEVDLRASHLTFLHALLGEPLDTAQDPYDLLEWPRHVVKLWIAQALGSGNARPRTWSRTSQKDYDAERPGRWLAEDFPIQAVGRSVKAKHPMLVSLAHQGITTLDLQYHEAEVLRLAMEDLLFTKDIPVLPIHDALIAPVSKAEEVVEALRSAFRLYVGEVTGLPSMVTPKVTLKGA